MMEGNRHLEVCGVGLETVGVLSSIDSEAADLLSMWTLPFISLTYIASFKIKQMFAACLALKFLPLRLGWIMK